MTPKRFHRRRQGRRNPPMDDRLRDSMIRLSRRDAKFYGHALGRLRDARGQTVEQQAESLDLTPSGLAMLGMCMVPRPGREADDLAAVAKHVGLTVKTLRWLLAEAEAVADGPGAA